MHQWQSIEHLSAWIRAIQLEAHRAGMTKAAEIAHEHLQQSHGDITAGITASQILHARDAATSEES